MRERIKAVAAINRQSTKENILHSTIEAIEKYGLVALTTRLIAEEAGVNNAALHYYFGTKDNLVEAALNQTADQMINASKDILSGDKSIDARLRELLVYMINSVERFPNILRALLMEPLYFGERKDEPRQLLGFWIGLAMDRDTGKWGWY